MVLGPSKYFYVFQRLVNIAVGVRTILINKSFSLSIRFCWALLPSIFKNNYGSPYSILYKKKRVVNTGPFIKRLLL